MLDLTAVQYRLQLRLVAAICAEMARQTMTVERMAKRLGCTQESVRKFLRVPTDINDRPLDLRSMSDAALALGFEWGFSVLEPSPAKMTAADIGVVE